jgi:hypothetical protein
VTPNRGSNKEQLDYDFDQAARAARRVNGDASTKPNI